MRLITFVIWVAVAGMTVASSARSAGNLHREADPISGEWAASFDAQGTAIPFTLKLKLVGHKVTGTSESPHTGTSTISKGSWVGNKLSFNLAGPHASIAVTGVLKDGKLIGEFRTEGMQGKWEAKKK
jgi:hypothetical protein